MMSKNMMALFEEQVKRRPDQIAIALGLPEQGQQLTYAELAQQAAQTATFLAQRGLRQGDRVLVFQPMSMELYILLLALFRLGAVAVFIDPSAGRQHLRRSCRLAQPQAFVGPWKAHLYRLLIAEIAAIPIKYTTSGWYPRSVSLQAAAQCSPQVQECEGGDLPALMTMTSGSTGQPKVALRSHAFLLAQHHALAQALSLEPRQVDLTTLPIFLLANLASGLTSIIPDTDLRYPARINAQRVLKQARSWKVERSAGSPAFYRALADAAKLESRQPVWPFQRLDLGGAPVFPPLLEQLEALGPQQQLITVYGSTEAEPMAHSVWSETALADREAMQQGAGLLVGPPVASLKLRIVSLSGLQERLPRDQQELDALTLAPGQGGEILVQGGHVLPAYWWMGDGPAPSDQETKIHLETGVWHRTGDAGYLDGQGRLWLLGRCQARIQDKMGELYPFAVECAASQVAGVKMSAMLAHRGRRLLMVEGQVDEIVLADALSWAHLDVIQRVEKIPVDARHNAKVDYTRLATLLD